MTNRMGMTFKIGSTAHIVSMCMCDDAGAHLKCIESFCIKLVNGVLNILVSIAKY